MSVTDTIEAEGHLIDSGLLSAIFDKIIEVKGSYEIITFDIGKTNAKAVLVDGVVLGIRRRRHRRQAGGCAGAGQGWRWSGSRGGTPRRDVVDRRTATLMYAGWDRRSAMRRKVPLTSHAPA